MLTENPDERWFLALKLARDKGSGPGGGKGARQKIADAAAGQREEQRIVLRHAGDDEVEEIVGVELRQQGGRGEGLPLAEETLLPPSAARGHFPWHLSGCVPQGSESSNKQATLQV